METVGKLLLKHYLPPSLKGYVDSHMLDKKGLTNLFETIAEKHTAEYSNIASALTREGFEIATRKGSSLSLSDLQSPIDKKKEVAELQKEISVIKKKNLSKDKEQSDIFDAFNDFHKQYENKILAEGLKNNKTLAKVVLSGSRASPAQYRTTVGLAGIVNDAHGQPMLDDPILNSFAEGLSLPDYMRHSFVARSSEVSKKLSTADSGYFSKQLSRGSMTLKIEEHDCGTDNGIEADTSDRHSIGCYLAKATRGYNKNNEITPTVLNDLKNKKVEHIIVRSPITCQSSRKFHQGALCQLCAGKREKGLPEVGSYVGISAASGLGEALSQATMNVRHNIGATKANVVSGFKLIDQMANIPTAFQGKAPLAGEDGIVEDVKSSSAGGHFVVINEKEYYVPTGFEVKVHKGQRVEAGDVLSEGIINPAEVVQLKGVGEGRKYFTEAMKSAFDEAGLPINRRNFEVISRAAIDHVKITSPTGVGNHLPDEVVSYSAIEKDYHPRPGNKLVRIDQALNKYLEVPVLHYTIGTRLTSRMLDKLKEHHIDSVTVHDDPPPFEPLMVRLLDVPEHVPDWMHQLYSTYLERRLLNEVNAGSSSSLEGPSPIAGLAYGVGFGVRK